jgi:hypothetical protein
VRCQSRHRYGWTDKNVSEKLDYMQQSREAPSSACCYAAPDSSDDALRTSTILPPATEVTLGGLDRDVTEQELDLVQFTPPKRDRALRTCGGGHAEQASLSLLARRLPGQSPTTLLASFHCPIRWPLFDVRLFRTAALECSRSGSARTRLGGRFFLRGFDMGDGLLDRRP